MLGHAKARRAAVNLIGLFVVGEGHRLLDIIANLQYKDWFMLIQAYTSNQATDKCPAACSRLPIA